MSEFREAGVCPSCGAQSCDWTDPPTRGDELREDFRLKLQQMLDGFEAVAREPMPFLYGGHYWRARAAISFAHFKASEMIEVLGHTPQGNEV